MKFTNYEKLSLLILCDIADGTKEIDIDFIRQAIFSDNTWGIAWQMGGIEFEKEPEPPHVKETTNILSMFSSLNNSYNSLSPTEKAEIDASSSAYSLKYRGFDGNNEGEYLSTVDFLTVNLARYTDLKIQPGLNSHSPMFDNYNDMYSIWHDLHKYELNASEIKQVIEA